MIPEGYEERRTNEHMPWKSLEKADGRLRLKQLFDETGARYWRWRVAV
jgi:hypothetical protein